jgi:hypothetical protein
MGPAQCRQGGWIGAVSRLDARNPARNHQGEVMTTRRSILAAAASAVPLSFTGAGIAATSEGNEHYLPGGTGGIQRAQFTFKATAKNEGYGIIALPEPGVVYMIPLTKLMFDESSGAKFALDGAGLVTVKQDGLYSLTANLDWPAQARGSGQDGYDTNLRKLMIKRVPVGATPPAYVPGEVTAIRADGKLYDNMAAHDTPGASVPVALRTVISWTPGSIPPGGMVYRDVPLPAASFTPDVGDHVRVTHTGLSDALLGPANTSLVLSARVVAPQLARVMIENRYGASAIAVPKGELRLLAESSVATAGNNGDSWTYLTVGPVRILADEKLLISVRSSSPGDFLQIDAGSFLRIANVVP